ncbi:pyridoxamine 5'-phosphate oxidase family protein [Clostridium sp.]|uniref:pyridoxamine 5'-phosphate oxidase family protein n=1 Tax=Clostridium sp. TaxID=1506 RepID=UPI002FCC5960
MIEIDYNNTKIEFIEYLNNQNNIVLSTCSNNKVTSRTMCFVSDGFVLYLLTGKRSNKCKQIEINENVSLCVENMQIEGKAKIIGSPMEDKNIEVSKIFRNKHKGYFERFAHFKVATFIEVKCDYLKQWKMVNDKDYFYCIDVGKERATKHT